MEEGELLLNWQKKPIAILLCNKSNRVFWFEKGTYEAITDKRMKALFFSEEGLQGSDLIGVSLKGANLIGANLFRADLRGANLYDANLRGANLIGANLYDADLRGAILIGANLYDADLEGANHSKSTLWPSGFDKSRLSS